ncbi:DUF3021 family protein [Mobilisporobacter senegalensis]|uniref:DUF3021 family protein n=1 Tax=Mobilisporobacter senegalensis TaxID=1329262 RepID=A0A3N1XR14_9FIRM|nr:DUF3021 family protein [Mobilisporobacter senegalensis]ROR29066.1 DUF3021 family protein [Mobilisporobacter senegalensis]
MDFKEFLKKNLLNYFIIVTGITIAIAVLGAIYDSNTKFGYEAFFSPLIIGVIAILPSFILYSSKELSSSQMFIRKILHFIVLEMFLITFGHFTGLFDGNNAAFPFAISVFIIYIFVHLIIWIIDSKTANEINKGLKNMQNRL